MQASEKQMQKLLSGVCFMRLASGAMAPWTGSGTKTPHPIELGAAHTMKTTSCAEKGINKLVLSNLFDDLQVNVPNNDFCRHSAHLSVIYLHL